MADGAIQEWVIEEYLRHVVPCEMPSSWGMEALKAQAIAARTYAAVASKMGQYPVFSDERSQVFDPNRLDTRTDEAISSTAGQYILYEGKPISAFFSAACGGQTKNSEDSRIGVGYLSYCRSVQCPEPPINITLIQRSHNVGMCQYGSKVMAEEQNKNYIEILKYYYTGVEIGYLP